MKNGKSTSNITRMFGKIFISFAIVFVMYLISKVVNNFVYDYFVFPFISIIIIFLCGVHVGKALERMKDKVSIKTNFNDGKMPNTEFFVKEKKYVVTNKKIIREDRVHIKVFDYDEIYKKDEENELQ